MTTQHCSQEEPLEPVDLGLSSIFEYEELQEATKFFNPSEVIGEGGFGVVYRGKLRDGRAVAIKELNVRHKERVKQFFNEVRLVSQLGHKNLVALYGCTNPEDEKMLLVYEFVPNGTVADHLHGRRFSKETLTWSRRLQIAIQTAKALAYLHSLHPPIIHRDVKTDNILLDDSFNVKVADFGLCRLLPRSQAHISTMPQGTQGYLDPEYNQLYKLTTNSDVYSFGVVLMELISGKAVVDVDRDDDEIWLVRMALNKMKNNQLEQLVDPELGYLKSLDIFSTVNYVAQLASECLQPTGSKRPSMMEIIESLKRMKKASFSERMKKRSKKPLFSEGMNKWQKKLVKVLFAVGGLYSESLNVDPWEQSLTGLMRELGMKVDGLMEAFASLMMEPGINVDCLMENLASLMRIKDNRATELPGSSKMLYLADRKKRWEHKKWPRYSCTVSSHRNKRDETDYYLGDGGDHVSQGVLQ